MSLSSHHPRGDFFRGLPTTLPIRSSLMHHYHAYFIQSLDDQTHSFSLNLSFRGGLPNRLMAIHIWPLKFNFTKLYKTKNVLSQITSYNECGYDYNIEHGRCRIFPLSVKVLWVALPYSFDFLGKISLNECGRLY